MIKGLINFSLVMFQHFVCILFSRFSFISVRWFAMRSNWGAQGKSDKGKRLHFVSFSRLLSCHALQWSVYILAIRHLSLKQNTLRLYCDFRFFFSKFSVCVTLCEPLSLFVQLISFDLIWFSLLENSSERSLCFIVQNLISFPMPCFSLGVTYMHVRSCRCSFNLNAMNIEHGCTKFMMNCSYVKEQQ